MNIGIDIGNVTTKITTKNTSEVFDSRVLKVEEIDTELHANNKILEINKENFIISNEGNYEYNKKKYNKDNFVQLLSYAIASNVGKDTSVNLCIGIPLSQYNDICKKELAKKIRNIDFSDIKIHKPNSSKVKKISKNFKIEKILIRPESFAIYSMLKNNPQIVSGAYTLIIDIGGITTDITLVNNEGTPSLNDSLSIELGLLNLYELVREYVLKNHNINFTINQAKDFTMNKYNPIGVSKNTPCEQILFQKLINEIKGKYPNISSYNIIVAGGGSSYFYTYFKQILPQTILCDNINANSLSYYKMCELKYKED